MIKYNTFYFECIKSVLAYSGNREKELRALFQITQPN